MKTKPYLIVALLTLLATSGLTYAQMPNDFIYMGKRQLCTAVIYGNSQWSQYWENSLKRENLNIGTHTTQSVMVMPAYGITKNLNVIASLPYVWTKTSAGNLLGQKGIQDISVWLKYRFVNVNGFGLHGLIGGSLPVGNYVPDFLPMSIGLQCRTASFRGIASYRHPATGLYVTGVGTYTWRSNITIDRDAYQANNRVYNTNEVLMPNAFDLGAHLGVLRKQWQAEVYGEKFGCTSGDNIRRNDMPFPTNNMSGTVAGFYAKYQPRSLGVNARVSQVIDGQNVGQSTTVMVGVLYQVKL